MSSSVPNVANSQRSALSWNSAALWIEYSLLPAGSVAKTGIVVSRANGQA